MYLKSACNCGLFINIINQPITDGGKLRKLMLISNIRLLGMLFQPIEICKANLFAGLLNKDSPFWAMWSLDPVNPPFPIPQGNLYFYAAWVCQFIQPVCSSLNALIAMLLSNSGVDGITASCDAEEHCRLCFTNHRPWKETRVYVPILRKIFNLSIFTGTISSAWKLPRVIPIYKSGDRHSVSNYRPISPATDCRQDCGKGHPQKHTFSS